MRAGAGGQRFIRSLMAIAVLLLCGCGMASSYRPAEQKTIRDFSDGGDYVKKVGIVALLNTSAFTSNQIPVPFMTAFLDRIAAEADDVALVVPGKSEVPPFLWNPPRIANGDLDVFTLASLARQEGMNAVVSPILMDIRVRTRDTGFWIFKDVAYSLQIQTAAAIYDTVTGARLDLEILTDEVDIDDYQAGIVRNGQEVEVAELVDMAQEMGETLGERMADAVNDSLWLTSVVAVEGDACVIRAGSAVGIATGDRFTVLDGSGILTGLDGQRFIVPGPKISEVTIRQVAPQRALCSPDSGALPPTGSILVPGR